MRRKMRVRNFVVVMLSCLIISSCQMNETVNNDILIKNQSIKANFPYATDLARQWNSAAELVSARTRLYFSNGQIIENYATYQFEAEDNIDDYLEIECEDQTCSKTIKDIYQSADGERISFLDEDWAPINLDKQILDTNQIIQTAVVEGKINIKKSPYSQLSTVLIGTDEGKLVWHVIYTDENNFVEVKIDPYTGSVLEINR